METSKPSGNAV